MNSQPNGRQHNLPFQTTSFVGRKADLGRIKDLLTGPTCRLLTVTGPGGIGKTRLAMQAAATLSRNFAHGVYFVPLQGIQTDEFLVSAVAEGMNFSLSGQQEPLAQVLHYLRDKQLLLLLDNFEQLLEPGGPAILTEILTTAPQVKLLVTSREALKLREEWLHPLSGLPVPDTTQMDAAGPDDAVQLFVSRARQVRPDFSLADSSAAVLRICQLVEGSPLAVELAAAWTKTLSCPAIAAEIEQNTHFLATPLRNVPDRHRSMVAVFDASWQLLSEAEQQVFKRLSVFRGGFQRKAAERVAGATLDTLAALVDKSLLRHETNDRYYLHELLRQYGQDRLAAEAEDVTQTHQAHCAYYAEFLDQRADAIESGDQRGAVAEIEAELENIRGAWAWAITRRRVTEIQQMSQTFTVFCHYQSRYLEAANLFTKAKDCLAAQAPAGQTTVVLANVLVRLGWFYIRLGKFKAAQAELARSQTLFAQAGAAPMAHSGADPLPPLSILATIRGDYEEAVQLGQAARQGSAARNDRQNLAFAFYVLTSATLAQGAYETARQYAQQACQTAEEAGNRWFLAYCLNEWGNVARALGDYDEAKRHFEKSYRIRQAFDDPEGMAVALNHLGEIAIRQGAFSEAQQRYRQSLELYQQINDSGGLAVAQHGLGQTACARQAYPTAARHFQRALNIAAEIQFLSLLCAILVSISELFFKIGRPDPGMELLAFSRQHPASDQETKDRAEQVRKQYAPHHSPEQVTAPSRQGQQRDFEAIVAAIQRELSALPEQPPPQTEPSPANDPQPRLDPLTERELDVLRLMAAGRTNREIGEELVLALGSVKWYASQIYSKLQVKNRTEAAAKARALGLLR